MEDLIMLDVMRSFSPVNKDEEILDRKILHDLLKYYAYFNPNISYCQGMNFLMGFLLLYLKD
jgi:hypothetical protein